MMAAKTKPLITITIFSQGSSGTFSRPLHTFSISLINSLILTLCGFGVLTTAIIISLISHRELFVCGCGWMRNWTEYDLIPWECQNAWKIINRNSQQNRSNGSSVLNWILWWRTNSIGYVCFDNTNKIACSFDAFDSTIFNYVRIHRWWMATKILPSKFSRRQITGDDKFINLIIYTWKMGTKEHLNVIRNFLDCQ